jgi:hypothetical protein
MATKELSLGEQCRLVEDAWWDRYVTGVPGDATSEYWVVAVYEERVIVQGPKALYEYAYTLTDDGVEFGDPVEVEREYQAKAEPVISKRSEMAISMAVRALRDVLENAGIDIAGGDDEEEEEEMEGRSTKDAALEEDDAGSQARENSLPDAKNVTDIQERPQLQFDEDGIPYMEISADALPGHTITDADGGSVIFTSGNLSVTDVTKEADAQKSIDPAAIKLLDETDEHFIVGGYGHVWGDVATKDLAGDYFTPESDLVPELAPVKLIFYDHALFKGPDGVKFDDPLGLAPEHETKTDEVGKWIRAQLFKRTQWVDAVMELVEKGVLAWSSGSIPHLVKREADGFLKRWPVVEYTLTPTPCEPRSTDISRLKAGYQAAGLEWLKELDATLDAEGLVSEGEEVTRLAIENERMRIERQLV